ncbi:hypothetical protein AVEN_151494-1 [Araneus ventricosus]|uniref:Transposase IS30-like HTH domain-containing protein n=1 Tax=Araneus ventricosus TaxID=182803 RepID=A0A4Y2HYA7_ARAVE|nr:hypothetical protein AVEN_151494-1 [Araneus ventricosus]
MQIRFALNTHCKVSERYLSLRFDVVILCLSRMPLRRRRSHYQPLTEFERGRVVGLREGGFSFRDIAERLGRNVSTVHDRWQQWSREGTASRRPGSGRHIGILYSSRAPL